MNEQDLMVMVGRKQVAFEQLDAEYTNLLKLLSKVLSGEIPAEQVSVDLATRSWKYDKPQDPHPADPVG